jgi:hypothetical protein
MGCLPLLVLFPLGVGVGYIAAGSAGALWRAGVGLLLGMSRMGSSIRALRARR